MPAALPTEMLIAVAMLAAAGLGLVGFSIANYQARRRSARAWRAYFHEGGLIRSLMARWKGPPKLTDRRDSD